jgi:hypothetical protein
MLLPLGTAQAVSYLANISICPAAVAPQLLKVLLQLDNLRLPMHSNTVI